MHLHLFCGFEELSIRHLCLGEIVVLCVQDLCEPAQGTSLSRLYHWGLNLYLFTSTTYIVFTLLWVNSEVLVSQTRKFRVHLLSSPNPEVPDLKPGSSGFGRQWILSAMFEWKFVGAPIHPPLGDITVLSILITFFYQIPTETIVPHSPRLFQPI